MSASPYPIRSSHPGNVNSTNSWSNKPNLLRRFPKAEDLLAFCIAHYTYPLGTVLRNYYRYLVNKFSYTRYTIYLSVLLYFFDTEYFQRIDCDASRLAFVRYKDLLDDVEMTARTLLKVLEYQIDFSEIDLKYESKESAKLHKGDLLNMIVADYQNGFYYIPFNRQIYYCILCLLLVFK
jgi:hypothetical protein